MGAPAIYDHALEQNRRIAWARFYRTRADLQQVTLWARELVEYVEASVDDPPAEMLELMAMIDDAVSEQDRRLIRRFVRQRLAAAA